jgi:hypothetical protein
MLFVLSNTYYKYENSYVVGGTIEGHDYELIFGVSEEVPY